MDTETIQQRLFMIRLALGGGVRPLPMEEFAQRIHASSGATYDVSALSRMETGKRKIGLDDVQAIAPLDPKGRGTAWLAFGEETEKAAPEGTAGQPFTIPTRATGPKIDTSEAAVRKRSGGTG